MGVWLYYQRLYFLGQFSLRGYRHPCDAFAHRAHARRVLVRHQGFLVCGSLPLIRLYRLGLLSGLYVITITILVLHLHGRPRHEVNELQNHEAYEEWHQVVRVPGDVGDERKVSAELKIEVYGVNLQKGLHNVEISLA